MDSHKFTVKLTFEVEKTGMNSEVSEAQENIQNYLPTVVKGIYPADKGLKIIIPEDSVQLLDEEQEV
jgi:hypothetical protein